jgi:hypothetical protein
MSKLIGAGGTTQIAGGTSRLGWRDGNFGLVAARGPKKKSPTRFSKPKAQQQRYLASKKLDERTLAAAAHASTTHRRELNTSLTSQPPVHQAPAILHDFAADANASPPDADDLPSLKWLRSDSEPLFSLDRCMAAAIPFWASFCVCITGLIPI